ncbi:helix-turn-helix domain-containing protein [Cohnella sp. CFH 77786]|uniref:response regulator n=1 Tax=Cohnella sp. CFH 77786 TaxID=2662265 RepID=UPI001C60EA7F|nr:response regulator [Cohnella sp. CFH 77786]MBW5445228.1 helix-turn-helix domain-containing protein [Cohnella sp. CFH 77786]
MYRLLIVDDEEIITDGLFEVFNRWMPEKLDVCKAYSGKQALNWLARTRIDIVLTDIRMPGMSGLDMVEEIRAYWPRCKIIFLTGYSEFDYAYKAIQMPFVRYLLKTEGYDRVIQTVQAAIDEIQRENQMNAFLQQSREQLHALEFMAQGDYIRHLLQDSQAHCVDQAVLVKEFRKLNIGLDPTVPVVLVLGHLSYPAGASYSERSEILRSSGMLWNSYLSEQTLHIGIVDKYENALWLLQPSEIAEEKFYPHMIRYLEGTLELIQETCLESLGLTISFTISGTACEWTAITRQHERLRQLQQWKIGDGISVIVTDRTDSKDVPGIKEELRISRKAEILEAHLEAGRAEKYFECTEEVMRYVQTRNAVPVTMEAYYTIALVLFACIHRWGLEDRDRFGKYGKLMRLDEHASMKDGFQYLRQIAECIFEIKHANERERASSVIDRICQYIDHHLHDDLSLVRLAEVHNFNPSYLSRFFKQERGINLSEYIDQCRARKAKELLRDSDLKVREVALMVGYDSAHSFTRFFKKTAGLTPQDYRDSIYAD